MQNWTARWSNYGTDNKKLDSTLGLSIKQLDAKLEHLGPQLYNLNGKANRLRGNASE